MRLLHAKTLRPLEVNINDRIPAYAILSHTWGAPSDEVTFKDLTGWSPFYKRKPGWAKIKGCCRQAITDGIEYIWIDTCCLDRPSKASGGSPASDAAISDELQSMWEYYADASVCYVHLVDVQDTPQTLHEAPGSAFCRSRWFTRGWTLPELLAPQFVRFYDSGWRYVGSKGELCHAIEGITGIPSAVVRSPDEVRRRSVACRMSWAARRDTAREEDLAYCLAGLFAVSVPVEYGEGRKKAFLRLQHQILRSSRDAGDQSIYAWGYDLPLTGTHDDRMVGMLAETPAAFERCGMVEPVAHGRHDPAFELTATGLQFRLPVQADEVTGTTLLNLECTVGEDYYLVLPLDRSANGRQEFERRPYSKPVPVPKSKLFAFSVRTINTQLANRPQTMSKHVEVFIEYPQGLPFELAEVYPPSSLQDVRPAPVAGPDETEGYFSFYLSDLPWTMLVVQSPLGHRFLISLERGQVPTRSPTGDLEPKSRAGSRPLSEHRGVRRQAAAVPNSRSLSGPRARAAFSLVHLLPMLEPPAKAVAWKGDGMDIGGDLLVGSSCQVPGAAATGSELQRVRIVVAAGPQNRPGVSSTGTSSSFGDDEKKKKKKGKAKKKK